LLSENRVSVWNNGKFLKIVVKVAQHCECNLILSKLYTQKDQKCKFCRIFHHNLKSLEQQQRELSQFHKVNEKGNGL
jgi:hypothetical protein